STSLVFLLSATIDGSLTTMPLPRAYTRVLAVPRSIARSLENTLNSDRRLVMREPLEWKPFVDIHVSLCLFSKLPDEPGFSVRYFCGVTLTCTDSKRFPRSAMQSKVVAPRLTPHWITTRFCSVFTPPCLFWAVIVIRLSPT